MPKRLLKLPICAVALLLACAVLASAADSATTQQPQPTLQSVKVVQQAPLTLGISNSNSTPLDLESKNTSRNATWTARAKKIGAQMVRIAVFWDQIAPQTLPAGFVASNPNSVGYNWTALDQQVRTVAAEGFQILITVNDAPSWAEGANKPAWAQPGSWKPNDKDFGQFATALATRYSGRFADPLHAGKKLPRVSDYQAWNEPNMAYYISPQYANEGPGANKNGASCPVTDTSTLESPGIYRGLLNSFYAAIKAVNSSDTVVSASVDPFSSPNCQPHLQNYRVAALKFDEALFCVNAQYKPLSNCSDPVHLNDFASNPYEPWTIPGPCGKTECGPTWLAPGGDVSIANVDEIDKALTAAVNAGNVLPAGKKGGFVTEVGWDQAPLAKTESVSQATAALWQEQAYYILAHSGVTDVLWWQLSDSSPYDGWPDASGEYLASGKAKPSATAYRFPFVTNRLTSSEIQIWGRSPQAGQMTIQELYNGTWVTVAKFPVSALEVFQGDMKLTGTASFRAKVGSYTSLTWNQTATVTTSTGTTTSTTPIKTSSPHSQLAR